MRQKRYHAKLSAIYRLLYKRFGPRHWWPADTRLEIALGAILTQNTAWSNVEKAIANLKKKRVLNIKRLSAISEKQLAGLIKPAGYYNIKSRRIKNFLNFLNTSYKGSVDKMLRAKSGELRTALLGVNGIGPETADSIMLYACQKGVFVVDSYTKRIFSRHGFIKKNASYEEIQKFFMENLPADPKLFNEYHALIVETGKTLCKSKKPLCGKCPIWRIKNA